MFPTTIITTTTTFRSRLMQFPIIYFPLFNLFPLVLLLPFPLSLAHVMHLPFNWIQNCGTLCSTQNIPAALNNVLMVIFCTYTHTHIWIQSYINFILFSFSYIKCACFNVLSAHIHRANCMHALHRPTSMVWCVYIWVSLFYVLALSGNINVWKFLHLYTYSNSHIMKKFFWAMQKQKFDEPGWIDGSFGTLFIVCVCVYYFLARWKILLVISLLPPPDDYFMHHWMNFIIWLFNSLILLKPFHKIEVLLVQHKKNIFFVQKERKISL